MKKPLDRSERRDYPRATSRRTWNELGGPLREVVYIFEREGERGGALWLLILECGHAVFRPRHDPKNFSAVAQAMFRPISEKLAPKRMQCMFCGSGVAHRDPWLLIEAYGGPKKP